MSTSFAATEQLYLDAAGAAGLSWQDRAACAGTETETWFGEGAPRNELAVMCAACPVLEECREYAIERPWIAGMWGGTTAPLRREVRRRRANGEPDGLEDVVPRCRNGHVLDEANAYQRSDGGVRCRRCTRDRWHARKKRIKSKENL